MGTIAWIADLGLKDQERSILEALTSQSNEVDGVVSGLGAEQVWEALSTSLRVYSTVRRAQAHLKPIIGKLLIELENYPQIYQGYGYRTYDEFITRGIPTMFGIPRSEAYRHKSLVRQWPKLTPIEFAEIGSDKLQLLGTFTNNESGDSERWLAIARNSTMDQLRDQIVAEGEADKGDLVPAVVAINTTVNIKHTWLEFVSNPSVQATVGTGNPGAILAAMIGECVAAWGG